MLDCETIEDLYFSSKRKLKINGRFDASDCVISATVNLWSLTILSSIVRKTGRIWIISNDSPRSWNLLITTFHSLFLFISPLLFSINFLIFFNSICALNFILWIGKQKYRYVLEFSRYLYFIYSNNTPYIRALREWLFQGKTDFFESFIFSSIYRTPETDIILWSFIYNFIILLYL